MKGFGGPALGRVEQMRSEGGFSLPELSVAIMVSGVIVAAGLTFIVVSAHQWGNQEGRVTATDKARNALIVMTSELRDATEVTLVDARTVEATIWNPDGTVTDVRFACSGSGGGLSECTRTVIATGAEETLVVDVTNSDNFSKVLGSDLSGTGSSNGALKVTLDVLIDDPTTEYDPGNPVALTATVKPRNCVGEAAAGVLNPTC